LVFLSVFQIVAPLSETVLHFGMNILMVIRGGNDSRLRYVQIYGVFGIMLDGDCDGDLWRLIWGEDVGHAVFELVAILVISREVGLW
jgi:hypothetical protein